MYRICRGKEKFPVIKMIKLRYSMASLTIEEFLMGLAAESITYEFTFGATPNFTVTTDSFNVGNDNMTWNYRVVLEPKDGDDSLFSEDNFSIREVFYDEDGEINFWSDEAAAPYGVTFQEIADDFDLMAEAFKLPVLVLTEGEDGEDILIESEEVFEYEYPDTKEVEGE